MRHREQRTAEGHHLVEGGGDLTAVTKKITEVDDAVAGLETFFDAGVQFGQPRRFAVNGADGPNSPAAADRYEPFVGGAAHLLRGGPLLRRA